MGASVVVVVVVVGSSVVVVVVVVVPFFVLFVPLDLIFSWTLRDRPDGPDVVELLLLLPKRAVVRFFGL